MSNPSGEIRGSVTVRPWRVGVVIDGRSKDEFVTAVERLTVAWGGAHMPIIDHREEIEVLKHRARFSDVDSLFCDSETASDEVKQFVASPGFLWGGSGDYGPFSSVEGLRNGVLEAARLVLTPLAPTWAEDDPFAMMYSAIYGLTNDRSVADPASALWNLPSTSPIETTDAHVSLRTRGERARQGILLVRANNVPDAVALWNARAFGVRAYAVPDDPASSEPFLAFAKDRYAKSESRGRGDRAKIPVWHATKPDRGVLAQLEDLAAELDVDLDLAPIEGLDDFWNFPGVTTPFKSSFRSSFEPGARSSSIRLPRVQQKFDPSVVWHGVVAAEVGIHGDVNQDPRYSSSPPRFRRLSSLINTKTLGSERARVSGEGIVLGVRSDEDEVALPFLSNLDIFRTLFDDEAMKFSQSDDGRFQARAAAILGGMFGGVASQPGVRAALQRVSERGRGMTRQEIQAEIRKNAGDWPDPLGPQDVASYAERETLLLLNSGILIPLLDVQCSHCRVISQVHPSSLDASVQCEFCGERFNLALSLQLTKPHWRYRLAGHLPPERVAALLPVLASFSLLSGLDMVEAPRPSHVPGLEIMLGKRQIEVDVAMAMGHFDQVIVLGEVKNANRIDENDVANLEELQRRLGLNATCMLMFATLKSEFGPEEMVTLRGHVERSVRLVALDDGRSFPLMPLVVVASDLSRPWFHKEHPWRWRSQGEAVGIFGIAIESCRRNLGLKDWSVESGRVQVTWES